jgi:hypothetical protein
MTDDAVELTEDEVRDVIETFWRLDADKAHLAEFLPIMDDEFVIRAVDEAGEEVVRFDGLAGLEDHQDGKMDIFDEAFELTSLRVDPGPVTVAHTSCVWAFRRRESRAPRSEVCVADLSHIWQLRRHPTRRRAVMTGHTCIRFEFRPGHAPSTPNERQAVKLASEELHRDPSAMKHAHPG